MDNNILLLELVGISEDDLEAKAQELGYSIRVVERDGTAFESQTDYSPTRLNVAVQEGKVINIRVG